MNPPQHTTEELHSALFANMVMQQGNLALMFLGKIPNPETGEAIYDLEGARMFIDQLEMLHAKTRGNLSEDETALLGQTLATVRMTFVEEARAASKSQPPAQAAPAPQAAPPSSTVPPAQAQPPTDDEKKKFVKKY
jgi:hypothetical protein